MADRTTTPAVELKDVIKSFGKVQALKSINLTVQQGETVVLLGPNGAGKTTAVALMLGMRTPTSGHVALFGRDPRDPRSRTRVGAMLQESGVPPTLRVREVTELFQRIYGQSMGAQRAIEIAQLEDKADALIGTLSGGQRQRLYFALAIVGNPDVLFLDEPTAGLDVESRRNFWDQIGMFVNHGKTIVLTTHNLEEADAVAKRIVVMNQGEIVAEGTPEQIKMRVGGKHIRFCAPQLHEADINNLPGTRLMTCIADKFDLYSMQPEAALMKLFQDGVTLSDLEVIGAGLEEAFISITHSGNTRF